jgi:hypothetical protein
MTTKTQPITSIDYAGRTCALRTCGGTGVCQGFVALSHRGERWLIVGGRAPHKESSSGKVWAILSPALPNDYGREYEFFPGVFDLVWVPATPAKTQAHA